MSKNISAQISMNPDFPVHMDSKYVLFGSILQNSQCEDCLEILLCIEGKGILIYEEKECLLSKGVILVFAPGNVNEFRLAGEGLFTFYRLKLDTAYFDVMGLNHKNVRIQNIIYSSDMEALVREIFCEETFKKPFYERVIQAKLQELLIYLLREYSITLEDRQINENADVVQKVMRYLGRNFRKQILLNELCADIGYSKYYTCHAFKKQMGETIVEYTNRLRCEYAEILLKSGNYSLREIVMKSGFSTQSYFTKIYLKQYGVSPAVMLEEVRLGKEQ